MLTAEFFDRDPQVVARELLGKVIFHKPENLWLSARIIETEAYYLTDKASHASLGYTEKRKALFMPAGTIYMYYARGGDSLNISCQGPGNAVLIKSAFPYPVTAEMLASMRQHYGQERPLERLCAGQTLLCKALGLKVKVWDQQQFDPKRFYIANVGLMPKNIVQTTRLGIPLGRDEHLPYRFIDSAFLHCCTRKPPA